MKKIFLASMLCMGAICAQAQWPSAVATLFVDCSFNSAGYGLISGSPMTGNFPPAFNNQVSGVQIPGSGYTVTLYDQTGSSSLQSEYRDYTSSNECLVNDGFNDRASSYRFTQNATGANVATFYPDRDYGGNAVSLPVGNYTLSELQALGLPNDALSSLTVKPGYYVRLYQDDFGTRSKTYKKSRANLASDNFDNITSNIEIGVLFLGVEDAPIVAIIYEDCQANSGSKAYLRENSYSKAELMAFMPDKSLSRIKIAPGYAAYLYDGPYTTSGSYNFCNFANNGTAVRDICLPTLSGAMFANDKTSSIQIAPLGTNPEFGGINGPIPLTFSNAVVNIGNKSGQHTDLSISPNPAEGNITINNLKEGGNTIVIYNALGQPVLSTTTKDTKANLDISAMAKGYYHIKVMETASKVQAVLRIVKR